LARLDLLHLSLHRLKLLLLLHKLLHIPLKLNQFFLELTTLSECFLVSKCIISKVGDQILGRWLNPRITLTIVKLDVLYVMVVMMLLCLLVAHLLTKKHSERVVSSRKNWFSFKGMWSNLCKRRRSLRR
jgi:hypothetical protein